MFISSCFLPIVIEWYHFQDAWPASDPAAMQSSQGWLNVSVCPGLVFTVSGYFNEMSVSHSDFDLLCRQADCARGPSPSS